VKDAFYAAFKNCFLRILQIETAFSDIRWCVSWDIQSSVWETPYEWVTE